MPNAIDLQHLNVQPPDKFLVFLHSYRASCARLVLRGIEIPGVMRAFCKTRPINRTAGAGSGGRVSNSPTVVEIDSSSGVVALETIAHGIVGSRPACRSLRAI